MIFFCEIYKSNRKQWKTFVHHPSKAMAFLASAMEHFNLLFIPWILLEKVSKALSTQYNSLNIRLNLKIFSELIIKESIFRGVSSLWK